MFESSLRWPCMDVRVVKGGIDDQNWVVKKLYDV